MEKRNKANATLMTMVTMLAFSLLTALTISPAKAEELSSLERRAFVYHCEMTAIEVGTAKELSKTYCNKMADIYHSDPTLNEANFNEDHPRFTELVESAVDYALTVHGY